MLPVSTLQALHKTLGKENPRVLLYQIKGKGILLPHFSVVLRKICDKVSVPHIGVDLGVDAGVGLLRTGGCGKTTHKNLLAEVHC